MPYYPSPCTPTEGAFCYFSPPPPPLIFSGDSNTTKSDSIPPPSSSTPVLLRPLSVSLLSAGVAILLLLLSFSSFFFLRRRRRRRNLSSSAGQQPLPANQDDNFLLYEEPEGENHVWYVRTNGLDGPTIASITKFVYYQDHKNPIFANSGSNCTVCLGEFSSGEVLRLLPGCPHAFHLPCIDTWLRAHTTCPLCRKLVVPLQPSGSSSNHHREIEIGDLLNSQNRIESPSEESRNLETVGDENVGVDLVRPVMLGSAMVLPIRRSISMDSLAIGAFLIGFEKEEGGGDLGDGRSSGNGVMLRHGNGSKESFVHRVRREFGRSLSSGGGGGTGGRFLRHGRSGSAVLPL